MKIKKMDEYTSKILNMKEVSLQVDMLCGYVISWM